MKLTKVELEKRHDFTTHKSEWKGQLSFDIEAGGWMTVYVNDEVSRKVIEICTPVFETATNERIEILKKEIKGDDNDK